MVVATTFHVVWTAVIFDGRGQEPMHVCVYMYVCPHIYIYIYVAETFRVYLAISFLLI